MPWWIPAPGRACGGCVVCCITPILDDPEIQKAAGVRCRHCSGSACKIYENRPQPCRGFFCGWRLHSGLGDEWRPDRSGVLILVEVRKAPSPHPKPPAITLMLLREPRKLVSSRRLVSLVRTEVLRGSTVYLALPGTAGFLPLRTEISVDAMRRAVRSSEAGIRAILDKALEFLERSHPRPHRFIHSGNDAGSAEP
jgi:hypothetical protein